MRILQIGKYYHPSIGGMESHTYWLSGELQKHSTTQVLVSATNRRTVHETIDGVPVTRLKRFGCLSNAPVNAGHARYFRNGHDIIHLHAPNPAAIMSFLRHAPTTARLVVTWHSDIVNQPYLYLPFRYIERKFLKKASTIICASARHVGNSTALAAFRDQCQVIPFGIDLDEFADRPAIPHNGANKPPVILFVGRLVPYKGVRYLLQAIKNIPAQLRIVGDGPLLANLRELSRRMGVEDKTVFLGCIPRADLIREYRSCDVFCLPSISRAEAFGLVILEAMAAGKPVVSTELGTATSLINTHGETGLVVPPADPATLGDALDALLADRSYRSTIGETGRQRVFDGHSKELMAQRTYTAYQKSIAHHSHLPLIAASTVR